MIRVYFRYPDSTCTELKTHKADQFSFSDDILYLFDGDKGVAAYPQVWVLAVEKVGCDCKGPSGCGRG